jgi:hypothetical protein
MSLNPLTPVTDFQSMLNRIFWFTSLATLIAVWLLRLHIPRLDAPLRKIDFAVEFAGNKVLPIPGGYLFPALAVGLLARIYRLHGLVSDWLGIRECFDIDVIIRELTTQLNLDLRWVSREQLVDGRHRIMRNAFYAYVSGSDPKIDPHLIHQALDAWSWFWIGIEASFVFIVTSFALIASGVYDAGFLTLGGTIVAMGIALPAMRNQCRRYAVAQVRAILADRARAAAVRAELSALLTSDLIRRQAA